MKRKSTRGRNGHNGRSPAENFENPWTEDEDNFVRQYGDLEAPVLGVALNQTFGVSRSTCAVSKRRWRLRKRDIREAITKGTPTVTIKIGTVAMTGPIRPSLAKKVYDEVVFTEFSSVL